MPLVVRWPGVTPEGAECRHPVVLTDLFYTLAAAAALPGPAIPSPDGVDLAPLLRNPDAKLDRDALFFHYPHYNETTTPVSAVRAGDWKLLEYFEDGSAELYDRRDDPAERRDRAREMPAKVAELRQRLHAWRDAAGAELPAPNPDFKPAAGR